MPKRTLSIAVIAAVITAHASAFVRAQVRATITPPINAGLPIVSPDGSHVAFVSDRGGATDVFVIGSTGKDELQLTHSPDVENLAGWTKDSKRVLFSIFSNNVSTLYSIALDGKDQQTIARVPGRNPIHSPDQARLAYMSGTWTATRLMISAIDGTNPRQITDGSSIAWNTHWSPNGREIAFTGRSQPKSELAIFIMSSDGQSLRQLTHIAPEEGGAQWPVWSPDGKHIAVQVNSRISKNTACIWIIDVSTGEGKKLGGQDHNYVDETPSWFPDGKRLAFQSNRTGHMEIWTMNADGSHQKQLTHSVIK